MFNKKKHYLQISFNNNLKEAEEIINCLPADERILIEAGTPLIKQFGAEAINFLRKMWSQKVFFPYIVADLKTMDRGEREVKIAKMAGASAAVVLGQAPIETIDCFIENCIQYKLNSMVDMMNVQEPTKILRKLKRLPDVVILHRGVDEESFNKSKPIPYLQINKIRSLFDVMISVAGGDSIKEIQRAFFNSADIVVVWKAFYQSSSKTARLAHEFLNEIR